MIETITIDTEQWAVVPRVLPDYRIPLFAQICYGAHAQKLWAEFLATAPRPEAGQQSDAAFANDVLILMDHINDTWDAQNHEDTNADRIAHWNKVANAADAILKAKQQPAPRPVPTSEQERQQYYQQLNQNLRDAGLQTSDPAEPDGGAV